MKSITKRKDMSIDFHFYLNRIHIVSVLVFFFNKHYSTFVEMCFSKKK